MSLRSLMKNRMTIQTSEMASQGNSGAINRQSAWINHPDFLNVKCNIQEKSKQTVTERFSRQDEEHNDLIYHLSKSLYEFNNLPSTQLRIIVLRSNPNKVITDFDSLNEEDFWIYKFMGHIEQVKSIRSKRTFYILRCERNNRLRL